RAQRLGRRGADQPELGVGKRLPDSRHDLRMRAERHLPVLRAAQSSVEADPRRPRGTPLIGPPLERDAHRRVEDPGARRRGAVPDVGLLLAVDRDETVEAAPGLLLAAAIAGDREAA